MKLSLPALTFPQIKMPTRGRKKVMFIALAIMAGIAIAVASPLLGWTALGAAPAVIFVVGIFMFPMLGLSALIFMIYVQLTLVLTSYHSIPSPAQPLLGLLVLLILWRTVLHGDRAPGWRRASAILILIAFWLFSVLVAGDSTLALAKVQKYTENAILAFVVVFFVQRPTSLRGVIWTLLAAGIFMGTISVFQNLTASYGSSFWGFGGWDRSSSGHRLTGPYGNPNGYAQVLVVLVPLALDRLWQERALWLRVMAGWALAVSVLTIIFTYSRNGFVTLMFAMGFLVMMRRPRIMPLVVTGALALLLLQFIPVTYTERITTLFQFSSGSSQRVSDESFRGRLSENVAAWRMFQDHPLFGVGLDNFQINYQAYSRQIGLDPRRAQRAPASFYLELLSEQGLVGFTVFMLFMVMIFRSLWNARQRFKFLGMANEEYMALAFITGLAGYMIFYISKNSAYPNVFWVLLGVALSIAQVAENSIKTVKVGSLTPLRGNE